MTKESWVPRELQGFLVYLVILERMVCQDSLVPKESLEELLLRAKEVPLGTQVYQVSQEIWDLQALLDLDLQAP